jgi:hypothetical protein
MASRETLPVLKEATVELTLGQCPLQIWVFSTEITDELILELDDILWVHDTSVNSKHHVLQLDEEVPLWCTGMQPQSSPNTAAIDNVLPT